MTSETQAGGTGLRPGGPVPGAVKHIRLLFTCLLLIWGVGTLVVGSPLAQADPSLPPGYLSSYDQGYDMMASDAQTEFALGPSANLRLICTSTELQKAERSGNPPANAEAFVAGCVTAARRAMGYHDPCDPHNPVCAERP